MQNAWILLFCCFDSVFPISGPALAVGNGDDPNVLAEIHVDDQIRKAMREVSSCTVFAKRPAFRATFDCVNRAFHFHFASLVPGRFSLILALSSSRRPTKPGVFLLISALYGIMRSFPWAGVSCAEWFRGLLEHAAQGAREAVEFQAVHWLCFMVSPFSHSRGSWPAPRWPDTR